MQDRRRQCPLQRPRIDDELPTVSRHPCGPVSGVALIFAQPVDMAGRIRAEGQQRSRALALFRTLTDDIARD